jgi:hypothetical protein
MLQINVIDINVLHSLYINIKTIFEKKNKVRFHNHVICNFAVHKYEPELSLQTNLADSEDIK